jgi:hypothetical protein
LGTGHFLGPCSHRYGDCIPGVLTFKGMVLASVATLTWPRLPTVRIAA